MFGMEIPDSVQGISFRKMFTNPKAATRESLYLVYNDLIRGVKDSRYKLIEYRNHAWQSQLFDLLEDPHEMHNLYGTKGYEEKKTKMRVKMDQHRKEWEGKSVHQYTSNYWDAKIPSWAE
jgi:arylsulfatase A-like enzyme